MTPHQGLADCSMPALQDQTPGPPEEPEEDPSEVVVVVRLYPSQEDRSPELAEPTDLQAVDFVQEDQTHLVEPKDLPEQPESLAQVDPFRPADRPPEDQIRLVAQPSGLLAEPPSDQAVAPGSEPVPQHLLANNEG